MNRKYIRNQSFLSEDMGDGVLLLNTADNQVIELNQTSARLWRRLNHPATWTELVQELQSHYPDVDAGTLEADAEDFVSQATACKAIQETGD